MLAPSDARRARLVWSIFFLALASALPASDAAAQSLTFSGKQIKTGGQYQLTADFNSDGRADLATAGLDVEILLGRGDGTFQPNVAYPIGTTITGIAAGDFNGDAKLDLAVSINFTVEVAVLLGNGDGTFAQPNRFGTGATGSPTSVVAADFNADGRLDLLTSDPIYCRTAPCFLTKTATVFLGNGDGTFQTPRQFDTVTPVQQFDTGDFNRDGLTDAVGAAAFGKVLILLSNGDGTFRQMPDVLIVQNVDNTDVAVGDYNGDGILDFVAAADGESRFGVVLGNGDGTFRTASVITDALMQRGWRIIPADFNRDGRLDVGIGFGHCCIDRGSGAFGLMLGNGDGTFQTILRFIRPQNGII
ncbi:MAG TPA: VCBS repeat-containing protein, partial [Pyrinomonadaceae bacterium]|nr:VCBS repeat-containing protein [Pyrinomonadaceae bacterium]